MILPHFLVCHFERVSFHSKANALWVCKMASRVYENTAYQPDLDVISPVSFVLYLFNHLSNWHRTLWGSGLSHYHTMCAWQCFQELWLDISFGETNTPNDFQSSYPQIVKGTPTQWVIRLLGLLSSGPLVWRDPITDNMLVQTLVPCQLDTKDNEKGV